MQSAVRLHHVAVRTTRCLLRPPQALGAYHASVARYSDSGTLSVSLDDKSGIAVMSMNNKPANLFSLEYLTELNSALDKLHGDKSCRGLVVTSGVPGIFSGGIQITELFQPKQERFNLFWAMLQDFIMNLYVSRLATVAAVNGHSPAGGCMVAMCCDYRLMASGQYTIGLNETQLGIMAPTWFAETMEATIGVRQTERALQLGSLFPVDTALKVGLVDEVCEEKDLINRAKQELQSWLKVPDHARQISKLRARQPLVDGLMARKQEDIDLTLRTIDTPAVQKPMALYLEQLKRKK